MEMDLLIKSGMGLLALLAVLVTFLAFSPKAKKSSSKKEQTPSTPKKPSQNIDLKYLISIVKNKKSTTKELKETLDLILKYHSKIHKKLGIRAHPEYDNYMDIIFTICRHHNTNKTLIVKFVVELEKANPEYKMEINDSLSKGLNSRGL